MGQINHQVSNDEAHIRSRDTFNIQGSTFLPPQNGWQYYYDGWLWNWSDDYTLRVYKVTIDQAVGKHYSHF